MDLKIAAAAVCAALLFASAETIMARGRQLDGASSSRHLNSALRPAPSDYIFRHGGASSPAQKQQPQAGEARAVSPSGQRDLLELQVRDLARQLMTNASEEIIDEHMVAVSTFVNLNHLYRTSALGRYLGEQLINEMQLAGAEVVELRQAPGIMIREEYGEYGLSRDMNELRLTHSVDAVLVGTYTVAGDRVFINSRLLRSSDGVVISSGRLAFDLDAIGKDLLADEGMPQKAGAPVKVRQLDR